MQRVSFTHCILYVLDICYKKDYEGNLTIKATFFSFFLDKRKRKATFQVHIILFKGRKYRRKIIFANQYRRQIETSTDKTLNKCNLN